MAQQHRGHDGTLRAGPHLGGHPALVLPPSPTSAPAQSTQPTIHGKQQHRQQPQPGVLVRVLRTDGPESPTAGAAGTTADVGRHSGDPQAAAALVRVQQRPVQAALHQLSTCLIEQELPEELGLVGGGGGGFRPGGLCERARTVGIGSGHGEAYVYDAVRDEGEYL
uniref:(northern house mosquito) hypothetical protein n=1 Tax=Culex pipiens TaxID=7175 RepID=A0A8D8NAD1_CULPI